MRLGGGREKRIEIILRGLYIKEAGHIPELIKFNVVDVSHAEDSIPVVGER